jgi:hypothetical protein
MNDSLSKADLKLAEEFKALSEEDKIKQLQNFSGQLDKFIEEITKAFANATT